MQIMPRLAWHLVNMMHVSRYCVHFHAFKLHVVMYHAVS